MKIIVDANIAMSVLDPQHPFHHVAIRRCLGSDGVAILNITRAEALIYPSRAQKLTEANAVLDQMGFKTEILENDVADRARALRADYGTRNFPMADAVVVAFGVVHGQTIVTCGGKWPTIPEADIETLALQ